MPTCIAYTPSQGYHFKNWKANQALYDASKCNTHCRDNNDKYYGIQHGIMKDFEPHVDISARYLWSQDDAKNHSQPKYGLMQVYSHLMVEQLHMNI